MWQGIPFQYLSGDMPDLTRIAISNLPHVIVESSPDYLGAFATFAGTLFAGCITAYVASKAITGNRKQMLQQQLIINSQSFINEIRVKISTFLSDIEKLSLVLKRNSTGLPVNANLDSAAKAELNELAERLDVCYYHILLMIGEKPQFDEMSKLIEILKDGVQKALREKSYYDVEPVSNQLIKATITCIDSEWGTVTKFSK